MEMRAKLGFNEWNRYYKNASKNGNKVLLEIEEREKNRTGIKNLKVGYNKISVTLSRFLKLDPRRPNWIRVSNWKTKLSNCERFSN